MPGTDFFCMLFAFHCLSFCLICHGVNMNITIHMCILHTQAVTITTEPSTIVKSTVKLRTVMNFYDKSRAEAMSFRSVNDGKNPVLQLANENNRNSFIYSNEAYLEKPIIYNCSG